MMSNEALRHSRYEIKVIEADGVFYLRIPEFGIVSKGNDLPTAYAEIRRRLAEAIEHYRAAGLEDELPSPASRPAGGSPAQGIQTFAIKLGITAALVAVFIGWASSPLANAVHRMEVSLHDAGDRFGSALTEIASPERFGRATIDSVAKLGQALEKLTPERKEELRRSLAVIVRELQPMAAELRPLFTTGSDDHVASPLPIGEAEPGPAKDAAPRP
jgi:predicted RNase H-like HicB family nuclease